jgi:EAL domain-containing protein (putative c-di-GMP-specific phosphodiesterase class I)
MAACGVRPGAVSFEITESVAMERAETSLRVLAALEQLGVSLSIDDFGTGYSSLSYLQRFPVSSVKIDRSFVVDVRANGNRAIVAAIVSVARALGMQTIAEGIERCDVRDALLELGVDLGQGFLFAHPLTVQELESRLQPVAAIPEHVAP